MHTSAETVRAVNKRTLGGVSPWSGVPALLLGLSSEGFVWWETVQNHWGRCLSACNGCNLSEQVGVASKARE